MTDPTPHRLAQAFLIAAGLAVLTALAPRAAADDHAVVLVYHHVGTDTPASTSVTPGTFDKHLDYLADHGFRVWPLSRILDRLSAGEPVPPDTVALTFDDAYESVLTEAVPRLRRRGWPFTVFVSTDYIDKDYAGYMTWDQLRKVVTAGGELGNHSRSHPHLVRRQPGEGPAAWRQRVRAEIRGAQERLEAETDGAVKLFAYPYGEFNEELESIVADAGFFGVGQQSGPVGHGSDWRAVPRFPMATDFAGMESFPAKVRSRPLPVTVLAPQDRLVPGDLERPVLRLRLGEGEFRAPALACYASGQGRMDVTWIDREGRELTVRPRQPIRPGRTRYNCTAPSSSRDGVYFWYSYQWLKMRPDGSWYPE